MEIKREEFLGSLLAVQKGLSQKETIEQADCFVFHAGRIWTYNDEICCNTETEMELTGAVKAGSLVNLLQKLADDTLNIELTDGEMVVSGKRKKAGVRMEADVLLPIESIEQPEKWKSMPEDFCHAIEIVAKCASKNEMRFDLCCVHITPEHVEACNNFQAARYPVKTPVQKNILIRQTSAKAVAELHVTEMAVTDHWTHFRNPSGVTISCRCYMEDFPKLDPLLDATGETISFPKGAKEAADVAAIFSSENQDQNEVGVEIKNGRLTISGTGTSGWYKETRKMQYDGNPLSFLIAPDLLKEVVSEFSECQISDTVLKSSTGNWTFVTSLGKAE